MTGADLIRAAVGDRCLCVRIAAGHRRAVLWESLEIAWFASCPALRCTWLCDQDLGAIPGERGPVEEVEEYTSAL
jgi:hypothetical protein